MPSRSKSNRPRRAAGALVKVVDARAAQGRAALAADRASSTEAAAATTTAASPRATRAAATSTTTASSISAATRTASRPRSSASNTIRTAARTSRSCSTPTASAATSSRPRASRSARSSCPGRRRRSSRATRCRCATFPSAPTVHCVEMLPGKGAQLARSAGAQRPGAGARRLLRAAAAALGRDPQGAHRLPRHHRRSRQRRAQPRIDRQGRPRALARRAPDGARRGDEPDRPPARRRRRPHRRGQPRFRPGACRPRASRPAATSARKS